MKFYRTRTVGVLISICCSLILSTHPLYAQLAPTNSATVSGSVSDVAGKPVVAANVAVTGLRRATTQTDAHGNFVFVGLPLGEYVLTISAPILGAVTRTISVQGDVNVAIQYEPTSANRLKTIASVSTNANASFNVTPASITQVNPIENAFEGRTSWRTILEQIPGVAQAGSGSGNYAVAAWPDGPLMPMKISIDGGLPYETATLLDNMPLIGNSIGQVAGAGTNLAVYPLNGFGSADIVRGPGASAPSILDSIGGSFVLHAPGAVSQNTYEFSVSNDAYGGVVMNGLAAVRFGKLSATATYGINDSPGPIQTNGPAYAFGITTVDGAAFTPYSPPGGCNPPGCYFGIYLVNPKYSNAALYGYYTGLLVCCGQQTTAWSQHNGSIALRYAFSPKINAEIFYAGSVTSTTQPAQYDTNTFLPPSGYTGTIPSGQIQLFNTTTPALEHQGSNLLEEKMNVQVGNGVLNLAALQNRSFCAYDVSRPASGSFQLYGGGNGNIYNGSTQLVGFATEDVAEPSTTNNRDLLLSYQTPVGENYHAGASFVKSYYNNPSSLFYSCDGVTLENTALPSSVSETTNELRFFVGGNLSQKISLDISEYFANLGYHVPSPTNTVAPTTPGADLAYTNVNYTYDAPRLGLVWRPTAVVAIRASAGGGFAGSALTDLVGSPPVNSFAGYYTQSLANVRVQPERSFSFDVGTDIRLPRNTILSFDVYRSNLYGQLLSNTTLTSLNYDGTGDPLYSTQFENLGVSRYEGILLDVHHEVPHGIYWVVSGGLTRGYIVSVPAGFYNAANSTCNFATAVSNPVSGTPGCVNLNIVPNINFNGTMNAGPGSGAGETGTSIPYAQGHGELGYRWNPDKYVGLTVTYYGNNNTYFRPAFVEFDGNIGYPLTKNVALLVNFRNITNIYGGSVQMVSSGSFLGVPVVAGSLYGEEGEEYGPRSVIVTTRVSL